LQSHYDNYVNVVDTCDDASMDEIFVTYVDDKHVDSHDYDANTMMIMIITMISLPVHVMHGSTLIHI